MSREDTAMAKHHLINWTNRFRNRRGMLQTLAAAMLGFVASHSGAGTIVVPGNFSSIQQAMDAARDGDTILVAPGTYFGPINTLGKALTLRSTGGPQVTLIDNSILALTVTAIVCDSGEGPDTVIDGFTVRGGLSLMPIDDGRNVINAGGDMIISGSQPTIRNCIFDRPDVPHVPAGSLLITNDGGAIIEGCTFIGNGQQDQGVGEVVNGGAITVFLATQEILIKNSQFIDNRAIEGGALWVRTSPAATIRLTGCEFTGNHATQRGGAIFALNDSTLPQVITAVNCVFNGNSAGDPLEAGSGGAWYAINTSPDLVNCTLANNFSNTVGGAFALESGTGTIRNCAFGNNFDGTAAQFNRDVLVGSGGHLTVSHTCADVLFETKGGGGFGVIELGDNIFLSQFGIKEFFLDVAGPDGFLGTGDENLQLLPGAVCIDAGDNAAFPDDISIDVSGQPRFVDDPASPDTGAGRGPIIDLGAFEFRPDAASSADINGDGLVNVQDLLLLLVDFGAMNSPADLDGDGVVRSNDLLILLNAWTSGVTA